MFKKVISLAMALSMLLGLTAWAGAAAPTDRSDPAYHSVEAIQERGVLTVSVSGDSTLNYLIPDNPKKYGDLAGTRDGTVPELCREIARELGVELKFVEYKTTEEQIQAAASGEVDLAVDNFLINKERLALYEMTDSFDVINISGDDVYLSTKPASGNRVRSEADLARARIAVVKATAQATNTAIQYPQAELVELADNQAVLDALVKGEADAGVFTAFDNAFAEKISQAIARGTVVQSSYMIHLPDYRGFGLILMKGNRNLCQFINTMLYDRIESGWMLECFKVEDREAVERGIKLSVSDYQNKVAEPADCPSRAFPDLDTGKWYHRFVDYAIENGLMGDAGDGAFSPNGTLTRAQVITVLWRLEGEPQATNAISFTDVAESAWYTDVIRWAVREGIMGGYDDGSFGPNNPIKWQELAAILYRYAGYKGYDVTAKGDPAYFTDPAKIGSWAYEAVQWACGAALLETEGCGLIDPAGNTKRCEFAAAITRFMENVAG